jgi:hypothetical protein
MTPVGVPLGLWQPDAASPALRRQNCPHPSDSRPDFAA